MTIERIVRMVAGLFVMGSLALVIGAGVPSANAATNWTVIGWNNLGMHCMDSEYSVFSILPPYNTINAQVVGSVTTATWLVKSPTNCAVTYKAVADPEGSINTFSTGKSDFSENVQSLFGVSLPMDVGLPVPGPGSYSMPGVSNTPQAMGYETNFSWFVAYGIPITPYDDKGNPNQYAMMRLSATHGVAILKTSDIVLPVSDEMNCQLCHLSGSDPAARPAVGWVNVANPGRDYRLNILRLHDQLQGTNPLFQAALTNIHYNANGLYPTVIKDHTSILCARCHSSEALPGSGLPGIPPLTRAVHAMHAEVRDPRSGMTLNSTANRTACYTCHPGSVTRCLRGAMGKAVAADGSMSMQCQSCHGNMSQVGATNRVGWLMEPTCQACHTGTALGNAGQIRYESVYTNGVMRVPTNTIFATNPNTPAAGFSLYRFSRGHGGLACAACHGSTHAEYPTAFRNDNLQSIAIQGHEGMLVECTACHQSSPVTVTGGPHGMHPIGNPWVAAHESNAGPACRSCHGLAYNGTELSRSQADRTLKGVAFWRGRKVGCYDCHNGATGPDAGAAPAAPTVANVVAVTDSGVPVALALQGSTSAFRIISQPGHGTVGLSGSVATYFPGLSFAGTDTFTYACSSAVRDSNLATGTVTVTERSTVSDGIPNWWRQYYFGGDGKTTNTQSCATADPDGDGMNNMTEYQAGSNPRDDRSAIRVFALDMTGNVVNLRFSTELGQSFFLERTSDLVTGGWTNVGGNIWGHMDSSTAGDILTNKSPKAFYRIRVLPYTRW
jgi:hypothetical protein